LRFVKADVKVVFKDVSLEVDCEPDSESLVTHFVLQPFLFAVEKEVAVLAIVDFLRQKRDQFVIELELTWHLVPYLV
jgi:hypothetical protein